MNIAIPKETKAKEHRVALVPEDVKKLTQAGHKVFVEDDAGLNANYPNQEYEKVGAKITTTKEALKQQLIVRVKEPAIKNLKEKQIIMSYFHIEKGQNHKLLNALLENNITAYAYEMMQDKNNRRVIGMGFEAGIVGMFEGLRTYAKKIKNNPFKNIKSLWDYKNKEEAYQELRKIDPRLFTANIVIAGYGQVSKGAQEVLAQLSHPPLVLKEEDTIRTPLPKIWEHLPKINIFLNAVLWYPGQDRVITKKDLKKMKKDSLIIDVSCDENGAIETCRATSWEEPTYEVNGIIHFCVDNLPSAIAHDSSKVISKAILPYVLKVANGEEITGLMTKNKKQMFIQQ
jgi:alanine dehydrogenase